jgi:glycosyltransferase involved in cell wall biosynthesis
MSESNSIDATVLIATRNRADLLERTLQGLELQRFSHDTTWQVVVVDNGSSDRTASVLSSARRSFQLTSRVEPTPGKNIALNQGLKVAKGRLLVFVDDDIIAEPNWLANLLAATERWPEDGIFGGRIIPELPSTTPNWMRGGDWFLRVAAWGLSVIRYERPIARRHNDWS